MACNNWVSYATARNGFQIRAQVFLASVTSTARDNFFCMFENKAIATE